MNYQKRSSAVPLNKHKILVLCAYESALLFGISVINSSTYPTSASNYNEELIVPVSRNSLYVNELKGTVYISDDTIYIEEPQNIPNIVEAAPEKIAAKYDPNEDDEDPLSGDIDVNEYVNILDLPSKSLDEVLLEYSKYFDHPGTPFIFRGKREISNADYSIIENIVLGEVGYCSFEQMNAEASLCINLMQQEKTDMYTLVMRPGVFLPEYAIKTKESTEKVTAAIEAAIYGLDFSIDATAACTYEWMDSYYQEWFDTLYLTTNIEDSSFYCNEDCITKNDIYYYSDDLSKAVLMN